MTRAAAAIGREGWPLDGEPLHFADHMLKIEAIAVGRDFAKRNHVHGFVGVDRDGPPFGQKEGTEDIANFVLDVWFEQIEPDAIYFRESRRS